MLPPAGQDTRAKEFNYAEYCKNASNSSNENVRQAVAMEIEMMKSFMEN